jgi:transcriptional regulator of arginine metabolism
MKNRELRHSVIREIIATGQIGNQEELLVMLRGKGLHLTQATLSRDLKMMKVIKISSGPLGYVYMIPEELALETSGEMQRVNHLAEGFLDVQFSGNLAVIKTLPGYASSIAAVIDEANASAILGTIAGDDTILVVLKEKVSYGELITDLIKIMPILKTKILVTKTK